MINALLSSNCYQKLLVKIFNLLVFIAVDRYTRRPKGYCFVTFRDVHDAEDAIHAANNTVSDTCLTSFGTILLKKLHYFLHFSNLLAEKSMSIELCLSGQADLMIEDVGVHLVHEGEPAEVHPGAHLGVHVDALLPVLVVDLLLVLAEDHLVVQEGGHH